MNINYKLSSKDIRYIIKDNVSNLLHYYLHILIF